MRRPARQCCLPAVATRSNRVRTNVMQGRPPWIFYHSTYNSIERCWDTLGDTLRDIWNPTLWGSREVRRDMMALSTPSCTSQTAVHPNILPLENGDRLTRAEFERR